MKRHLAAIITLAFFIIVTAIAVFGVDDMRGSHDDERLAVQKKAVEQAAVLCYAVEGAYPPDIGYLAEKYGLILDSEHYIFHYQTYGGNIRPEVKVFARTGGAAYD